MGELKTYSVLLAWQNNDREQGEYGTYVRAHDAEEAEKLARLEMRRQYMDGWDDDETAEEMAASREEPDGTFGGRVIDMHEGAIWKANDMEQALRYIAGKIGSHQDESDEVRRDHIIADIEQKIAPILAEIDKIPGPEDFKE